MGDKVGLWVDHSKAMVVTVPDRGTDMTLTLLESAPRLCRFGESSGIRPHASKQGPAGHDRPGTPERHHTDYFDTIIKCIRNADAILILGPCTAKDELTKRLAQSQAGKRIIGVETVGQMTHGQIAAQIRRRLAALVRHP